MKLDVAAATVAVVQLMRRVGFVFGRVDFEAGLLRPETDVELVFRAWLTVVMGAFWLDITGA